MSPARRFRPLSSVLLFLTGMRIALPQIAHAQAADPDLIAAIRQNDLKRVQSLLAHGANPNSKDARGDSALDAAAVQGNADLVVLLLDKGAEVNTPTRGGITALMMAAAGGRIVKTDARGEVDYGQEGFFDVLSARGGHRLDMDAKQRTRDDPGVAALKALLAHGAQVNAQAQDGKTALWWAVRTQDITKVRLLLDAHTDPNIPDKETGPALGLAVFKKQPEIVQALLRHHADPNRLDPHGQTPLAKAIYWHHRDIADLLLAGGADINKSAADLNAQGLMAPPLLQAIRAKNAEGTRYLLEHHADVNQRDAYGGTALGSAIRNDDLPLVKRLLDRGALLNGLIATNPNGPGCVPVNYLSGLNNPALLELLIARGARIHALNREGVDALFETARQGNPQSVKVLLQRGANPNSRDPSGTTAMMMAAEYGSVENVRLLLEYGADVNARDSSQETALGWGLVRKNNIAVLKLLTDHGADINVIDRAGHTPLIGAVMEGDGETVLFLLQHGADRAHKDYSGKNALMWAREMNHADIIPLLQ
jgi:ankyrin repeat protein